MPEASPSLNAAQLAAATAPAGPLLIIAGAGTGKTQTLAHRVAHLIKEGADPGRLLLLTFTRRAAEIMINRGNVSAGTVALRAAWVEGDFTLAQERGLLVRFSTTLRPEDHQARFDRLMWDGQPDAARRMLALVPADYRAVAEARLALAGNAANLDAVLAKVPAQLRLDPGLAFEEARWRRKKDDYEAAARLLSRRQRAPPSGLGRRAQQRVCESARVFCETDRSRQELA